MRAVIMALVVALSGCSANSVRDGEALLALQRSAASAYAAGDYVRAAADYQQLGESLRSDPEPYFKRGNALAQVGEIDAAISAYREALLRDPKHARAWHNLVYLQLQGVGKSVAEMYLHLDRNDPRVQPIAHKAERVLEAFDVAPAAVER